MARAFSRAGRSVGRAALSGAVFALAVLLAWLVFLLLPLLEQATRPSRGDLEIRSIGAVDLPPPPPPPPEAEKEEESEEPPPALPEPSAPLDLAQLELALNPVGGLGAGDFLIRLPGMDGNATGQEETDEIFSAADLDQMPRAVSQTPPDYPPELRRQKVSGTVYVIFIVDRSGRVLQPSVEQAPHPKLGAAALAAVRKWRFEPGKRQGRAVPFKMRVPITFLNQ